MTKEQRAELEASLDISRSVQRKARNLANGGTLLVFLALLGLLLAVSLLNLFHSKEAQTINSAIQQVLLTGSRNHLANAIAEIRQGASYRESIYQQEVDQLLSTLESSTNANSNFDPSWVVREFQKEPEAIRKLQNALLTAADIWVYVIVAGVVCLGFVLMGIASRISDRDGERASRLLRKHFAMIDLVPPND